MFKMVAQRYAKALYDTAKDSGSKKAVTEDIAMLEKIFGELPEVRKYCLSGKGSDKDGTTLVEVAFLPFLKTIECKNTISLLAENLRLTSIPFLADAYSAVCAEDENRITVLADFAHPPVAETVEKIKKYIADKTGKSIDLEQKVSPELLGGYVLTWQNRMIDDSVKGRLKQLRKSLAV